MAKNYLLGKKQRVSKEDVETIMPDGFREVFVEIGSSSRGFIFKRGLHHSEGTKLEQAIVESTGEIIEESWANPPVQPWYTIKGNKTSVPAQITGVDFTFDRKEKEKIEKKKKTTPVKKKEDKEFPKGFMDLF